MNKWQLVVLWVIGLYVSLVLSDTGLKLLLHAKKTAETLENGYPFTLLAGTAWGYIIPLVIVGALLMVSFRGKEKK